MYMKKYTISSLEGKLILFATILASGMAFLDSTVVTIAIPIMQSKFSATITDMQWVVNSYALMLAALILISGSLGDRFGRKKIFIYGICLFVFSSFLCSVSQTTVQLIFPRALQGIGAAMMTPGSLSIINVSFEESIRGRAIGLWSGFSGGLAALGPFLGGYLVQTFGWPSIFYINIPVGLLAFFIAVKFVPETKNIESRKLDWIGNLTIFLGLLGITYALMLAPKAGWQNTFVLGSFIGGIVLTISFIFNELHSKYPLVPVHIFKSSLVTGANIATLFLYFALSGVIFFLVLNLQQVQHFSPLAAGVSMLPTILLITFLSGYGGSLADKIGPRIPMIVGPLIVSLGMGLLTLAGRHVNYFLQIMPGLILFGLGMSLVIAPLTKSALAVDHKYSGTASGVNNAVARTAGLLAIALLGAVVLSSFSAKLTQTIASSHLHYQQEKQILDQKNKLGAIEIPKNFSQSAKEETQTAIENSFIYSFRWAMGMNAFLAFLSAVVSFFTIY